jgi:ankyrin repeat protein
MLLSAGAKLDIQEREYLWTPLMVAVMNGKLEAVYILVHKGASMGVRDRDGQTARTLADKYSQKRISSILNELLRRK